MRNVRYLWPPIALLLLFSCAFVASLLGADLELGTVGEWASAIGAVLVVSISLEELDRRANQDRTRADEERRAAMEAESSHARLQARLRKLIEARELVGSLEQSVDSASRVATRLRQIEAEMAIGELAFRLPLSLAASAEALENLPPVGSFSGEARWLEAQSAATDNIDALIRSLAPESPDAEGVGNS